MRRTPKGMTGFFLLLLLLGVVVAHTIKGRQEESQVLGFNIFNIGTQGVAPTPTPKKVLQIDDIIPCDRNKPLVLTFLLDTALPLNGTNLGIMKQGITTLAGTLHTTDEVSMVVFREFADTRFDFYSPVDKNAELQLAVNNLAIGPSSHHMLDGFKLAKARIDNLKSTNHTSSFAIVIMAHSLPLGLQDPTHMINSEIRNSGIKLVTIAVDAAPDVIDLLKSIASNDTDAFTAENASSMKDAMGMVQKRICRENIATE